MSEELKKYDEYFRYFNSKYPLEEKERQLIETHLSVKTLPKRQYFLRAGDIAKTIAFVNKGILRSYTTDYNGVEHILDFAPEGWFISDLYSFLTGEPSIFRIEAIEDCELVLMSKSSHNMLLRNCGKYLSLSYDLMLNAYVNSQRRINAAKSDSLEKRYEDFLKENAQIINRIPQYMIASYLGLTPETLSRIRRRMVQ